MAGAEEPATTAPERQAVSRASQTAESFSTDRRCMGEPPDR